MKFNIQKQIQNLCQPAYIYLILTCVTTLMYVYMIMNKSSYLGNDIYNYTQGGLIFHILISIAWVYILDQMCKISSVGKKFAWFLVLLPFFIISLIIIGLSCSISYVLIHQEEMNELKNKLNQNNSHNLVER